MQEIPRVIVPAWVISKKVLVGNSALTLLSHIRYPDASNTNPTLLEPNYHLFPQWFIELLRCVSYRIRS